MVGVTPVHRHRTRIKFRPIGSRQSAFFCNLGPNTVGVWTKCRLSKFYFSLGRILELPPAPRKDSPQASLPLRGVGRVLFEGWSGCLGNSGLPSFREGGGAPFLSSYCSNFQGSHAFVANGIVALSGGLILWVASVPARCVAIPKELIGGV